MDDKLIFCMEKAKLHEELRPDSRKSLQMFDSPEGPRGEAKRDALRTLSLNQSRLSYTVLAKKRKSSCLRKVKKTCQQETKYVFQKPHLFYMDSQDLRKELLSHKSTISSYLSYSISQDNSPLNLNISKIIQNECFCKHFFTFRRDPGTRLSKHVFLVLDGCFPLHKQWPDTFSKRLFEENTRLCFIEFLWQDFLRNKIYFNTPKVGGNYRKMAQSKKHHSNCLGRLTRVHQRARHPRQTGRSGLPPAPFDSDGGEEPRRHFLAGLQ